MNYEMRNDKNRKELRSYKRMFIYKPIQRQYFLWMAVITILSAFALSFVVHQTIRNALDNELARTSKVSLIQILTSIEGDLLIRIFVVLFVAVIVSAIISVFFLHRIVGPIFRIQDALRKIADGHVPDRDIKLRTGDFFAELASELNRVMSRLRNL